LVQLEHLEHLVHLAYKDLEHKDWLVQLG
jgi:hypothetical protein